MTYGKHEYCHYKSLNFSRTHLNIKIIYVIYVARIEILDTTRNAYTSFKAYHCGHLEKNTFQRI